MKRAETALLVAGVGLTALAVIAYAMTRKSPAQLPTSGRTATNLPPAPSTEEHQPWEIYWKPKPDPTEKLGPFTL